MDQHEREFLEHLGGIAKRVLLMEELRRLDDVLGNDPRGHRWPQGRPGAQEALARRGAVIRELGWLA